MCIFVVFDTLSLCLSVSVIEREGEGANRTFVPNLNEIFAIYARWNEIFAILGELSNWEFLLSFLVRYLIWYGIFLGAFMNTILFGKCYGAFHQHVKLPFLLYFTPRCSEQILMHFLSTRSLLLKKQSERVIIIFSLIAWIPGSYPVHYFPLRSKARHITSANKFVHSINFFVLNAMHTNDTMLHACAL